MEKIMTRICLTLAALGVFALTSTPAKASDWIYRQDYRQVIAARNHDQHHDDLDHRDFHRELEHRDAHRYPMTWRQHDRLHDALEHDAFHDNLEHNAAHRSGAYYPPRIATPRPVYGFGFGGGRGISIRIGH
jgi:hypothetical protein